jgi:hypothetical protein
MGAIVNRALADGATAAALSILLAVSASPAGAFPAYGNDPDAAHVIEAAANGQFEIFDLGYGPYDGVDDQYIGFVNESDETIDSLNLSSSACIGCFNGDGLAAYGAPTIYDPNGYGGPQGFFTNNTGFALTINFAGGVAPGATTYFSLEGPLNVDTLRIGVPEPASWAMMLVGFGGLGVAMRSRRRLNTATT